MRVKINEDLTLTENNFSVVSDMREMKGKTYKVDKYIEDCVFPFYVIDGWSFDKRDCVVVEDYDLVDNDTLEDLNGFVIDLSTTERVYYELEKVVHDIEDRVDIYRTMIIEEIRDFVLEYYTTTYKDSYILVKAPNVYQIVEEDLFVKRS